MCGSVPYMRYVCGEGMVVVVIGVDDCDGGFRSVGVCGGWKAEEPVV